MPAVKRKPTNKSLKKKCILVRSIEKGKKNMKVSEKVSKNTFNMDEKQKKTVFLHCDNFHRLTKIMYN